MFARCDLAQGTASVGEARRFVANRLGDWGLDRLSETAVLLVSEAVTNAVLHAATRTLVCLEVVGDVARFEVHDGSRRLPVRRHYSVAAATGRGLRLVEALADRWGADETDSGKVVWFELVLEPADVTSAARSARPGLAPTPILVKE